MIFMFIYYFIYFYYFTFFFTVPLNNQFALLTYSFSNVFTLRIYLRYVLIDSSLINIMKQQKKKINKFGEIKSGTMQRGIIRYRNKNINK